MIQEAWLCRAQQDMDQRARLACVPGVGAAVRGRVLPGVVGLRGHHPARGLAALAGRRGGRHVRACFSGLTLTWVLISAMYSLLW